MSDAAETRSKPAVAHRKKARTLLLQALYQWQISDYPVNAIEAQYRADNSGKIDWDYFHEIFTGITLSVDILDESFVAYLDREITQLNPIELAVLRIGSFELSNRIDIPYRVVINESIELAKKFGATDSHKYVNGVLDKLAHKCRKVEIDAGA